MNAAAVDSTPDEDNAPLLQICKLIARELCPVLRQYWLLSFPVVMDDTSDPGLVSWQPRRHVAGPYSMSGVRHLHVRLQPASSSEAPIDKHDGWLWRVSLRAMIGTLMSRRQAAADIMTLRVTTNTAHSPAPEIKTLHKSGMFAKIHFEMYYLCCDYILFRPAARRTLEVVELVGIFTGTHLGNLQSMLELYGIKVRRGRHYSLVDEMDKIRTIARRDDGCIDDEQARAEQRDEKFLIIDHGELEICP